MAGDTRVLRATPDTIETAASCLTSGGLVAFPTETVYGLGANARDAIAVAKLYAAKGRPSFNPLIAHVADAAIARRYGVFNAEASRLAAAFWPGPLTLVLRKAPGCPVCDLATAGLDTIALRVPAHPVAQSLLRAFGNALVAPSANRSGHVSPTSAAHVLADLDGRIDFILDGGSTSVGIESSIVACLDGATALLRPGGLSRADIEAALGRPLDDPPEPANIVAPGMLASHYAPRTRLRLDADHVGSGEALLAFGPSPVAGADQAAACLNLSLGSDTIEAAANLFAHLRELDAKSLPAIAVMPIPNQGLGEAINDRLRRAAAERPQRGGSRSALQTPP